MVDSGLDMASRIDMMMTMLVDLTNRLKRRILWSSWMHPTPAKSRPEPRKSRWEDTSAQDLDLEETVQRWVKQHLLQFHNAEGIHIPGGQLQWWWTHAEEDKEIWNQVATTQQPRQSRGGSLGHMKSFIGWTDNRWPIKIYISQCFCQRIFDSSEKWTWILGQRAHGVALRGSHGGHRCVRLGEDPGI